MVNFWLCLLYLLVSLTLLAAIGSWLRSLSLRDPATYVHHGVPARAIAVCVTLLLILVLGLTSMDGLVPMFIDTIAVLLVVASVAALIGGSGVVRKLKK